MDVTIRRARDEDYLALCDLWRQLDRFHAQIQPSFFRQTPGARSKSDLYSALRSDQHAVFVAALGQDLIGIVQLHLYEDIRQSAMLPRRRAHVEDLIVEAQYRGRGVGRRLMEFGATWAKAQGASQLVLTVWDGNDQALEFYTTLGYRAIHHVLVRDVHD